MSPPFFVAAAPRSRTRWLSGLLTLTGLDTGGPCTVCHHEAGAFCSSRSDFYGVLSLGDETLRIGASGPELVFTDFLETLPDARLLVVHRDPQEVWDSVVRMLDPDQPLPDRQIFFEMYPDVLASLQTQDPHNTLHVSYEALSDAQWIERIHTHLLPGIEFTENLRERAERLQKINIALNGSDLKRLLPTYRHSLTGIWQYVSSPASRWRPQ